MAVTPYTPEYNTLQLEILINGQNEGFGRTFYGGRNVIMSLWAIDDNATTELMQLFIEELARPQSYWPVSPLRQAMLRYREIDPDPLHWAAFQPMGVFYPGRLAIYLDLELENWQDRFLAQADPAKVLASIDKQGFYIQFPPSKDAIDEQ